MTFFNINNKEQFEKYINENQLKGFFKKPDHQYKTDGIVLNYDIENVKEFIENSKDKK